MPIKSITAISFTAFIALILTGCNQQEDTRKMVGRAYAEKKLASALSDRRQHNVINHKTTIIRDRVAAIRQAELLLFSMYGKDRIIKQRPYETHFIDRPTSKR